MDYVVVMLKMKNKKLLDQLCGLLIACFYICVSLILFISLDSHILIKNEAVFN